MFTYTIRIKKRAVAAVLAVIAVAILTLALLPPTGDAVAAIKNSKSPPRCSNNEDRVAWLQELGWEVETEPCSELSVVIPEKFDEIYTQYSVIQRKAGFRLDRHKGRTADKYCYVVTNYGDGSETAIASILQRGDKIIAADLSGARLGGFLKPLLPRTETKMK